METFTFMCWNSSNFDDFFDRSFRLFTEKYLRKNTTCSTVLFSFLFSLFVSREIFYQTRASGGIIHKCSQVRFIVKTVQSGNFVDMHPTWMYNTLRIYSYIKNPRGAFEKRKIKKNVWPKWKWYLSIGDEKVWWTVL